MNKRTYPVCFKYSCGHKRSDMRTLSSINGLKRLHEWKKRQKVTIFLVNKPCIACATNKTQVENISVFKEDYKL